MTARRFLPRLALAGAFLLGATAAAPRDRDELAGRVAGRTQDCINPNNLYEGPEVLNGSAVAYRDGPRLWVSHPTGACPDLKPLSTIILIEYGGQLCEHDRFRVRNLGETIPSNFCFFGKWTAFEKPKA